MLPFSPVLIFHANKDFDWTQQGVALGVSNTIKEEDTNLKLYARRHCAKNNEYQEPMIT